MGKHHNLMQKLTPNVFWNRDKNIWFSDDHLKYVFRLPLHINIKVNVKRLTYPHQILLGAPSSGPWAGLKLPRHLGGTPLLKFECVQISAVYCTHSSLQVKPCGEKFTLGFNILSKLYTVNIWKQNIRFGKPNQIWFGYGTFWFQMFGTNRTNWNKCQFQAGLELVLCLTNQTISFGFRSQSKFRTVCEWNTFQNVRNPNVRISDVYCM